MEKACSKCKIVKPVDMFYYTRLTSTLDGERIFKMGYVSCCKECYKNKVRSTRPRKDSQNRLYSKVIKPDYRFSKINFDDGTFIMTNQVDQEGLRKLIKEGYSFILKDGFAKYIDENL